jgi:hypothetical protein
VGSIPRCVEPKMVFTASKKNKKNTTVGTFPKSNRKIVERCKIDSIP